MTAPVPSVPSEPTEVFMAEHFGPAARGIPRGGNWKSVKKREDVLFGKLQVRGAIRARRVGGGG